MRRKTIGEVLRHRMATAGATQASLAKAFGVTQSAISRWINGNRRPWKQEHRRKLLALGVDPRHL